MSLGTAVAYALDNPDRLPNDGGDYDCPSCGRTYRRMRDDCPACGATMARLLA